MGPTAGQLIMVKGHRPKKLLNEGSLKNMQKSCPKLGEGWVHPWEFWVECARETEVW